MSYAHNNHYEWIESCHKIKCSELGKEVANVIGFVGCGIYNAPIKTEKVEWDNPYYIEMKWFGGMANYDGARLTQLIIECFRRMLRVDISPCNMQYLKIRFWKRKTRDLKASISERIPTIEHMIEIQDELFERKQQLTNKE